jgi:hypothetical protein
MDLKTYDTTELANAGADLELMLPNGKAVIDEKTNQPVTITLLGVDSKKYQDLTHTVANRRIVRRSKSRKALTTSEEVDSDQLQLLVEMTIGWSGIVVGGNALEFSKPNARMLYTEYPWIREQAEDFIQDRANYLGESTKRSKSSPNVASSSGSK